LRIFACLSTKIPNIHLVFVYIFIPLHQYSKFKFLTKNKISMKKIFTLISLFALALGVQAQTLINYPNSQDGITKSGTTDFSTVKIYTNTTTVNGVKFANGYTTSDALNSNYATISVEGGFKAGDVITIAGAFNNSDETKKAAIDIFTVGDENAITVLYTTAQFVNGRTSANDPVEETYTLTEDYDILYLGRNGNTGTFITTLRVDRGEVKPSDPTAPTTWDFTQALSDNDAANLAADANTWTFDETNNYWKNAAALAEKNVFVSLTAGNAVLDVTKGLTFARDNSEGLGEDRVRIKSKNYVAVNGSKISISLGSLVKDDVVKLRFKGAGESERSLTVSNTELVSGSLTTADVEEHEVELKVLKDNVVTLTTTNGFQFMAITVNAELPTGVNGVKAEGAKAKVAGTVNLAGQQVGADYKGVVIKDGKKVMQ
jgi:hypothetical protein